MHLFTVSSYYYSFHRNSRELENFSTGQQILIIFFKESLYTYLVQIEYFSKTYTQVYETWITSPNAGMLMTAHDF